MAATQQMLNEAQSALHALLTGSSVVEFRDQNGELVRYSKASKNDLVAYIAQLKAELGLDVAPTGPMRVWM